MRSVAVLHGRARARQVQAASWTGGRAPCDGGVPGAASQHRQREVEEGLVRWRLSSGCACERGAPAEGALARAGKGEEVEVEVVEERF